jgi:hypothetical protein
MNLSLLRARAAAAVPPVSAATPVSHATVVPDADRRWEAWVTKGRVADRAFMENVRALFTLGVALAIGAAGLWVILGG